MFQCRSRLLTDCILYGEIPGERRSPAARRSDKEPGVGDDGDDATDHHRGWSRVQPLSGHRQFCSRSSHLGL